MLICPAATARVPLAHVWRLLSEPELYAQWWDAEILRIYPPGPAAAGQRIVIRSKAVGRYWKAVLQIEAIDHTSDLIRIDARLPFGLIVHTRISCVASGQQACRIQYG